MTDELGLRLNEPFLNGVLLAANALPDAHLLVDGPGCVAAKARRIVGPHDLCSTLLNPGDEGRVSYSGVDVFKIVHDMDSDLLAKLRAVSQRAACGVTLLTALPMCGITGTDYGRLSTQARSEGGAPIIEVSRRAIADDWLGGYGAALTALAENMDLSEPRTGGDKVAVVGYLMDRNEGDHRGNVTVLEQMIRALGLESAPVWLSANPYERLRDVRHAGTIISLPHGRDAARVLARRLDAQLVETDLPFGLDGTRRWLEQVATATGRESEAAGYIQRELDRVIPRIEWVVPQIFLNRSFAFVGDPHYSRAFVDLISELGGTVPAVVITADDSHLNPDEQSSLGERTSVDHQPDVMALRTWWQRHDEAGVDMLVSSSFAAEVIEVPSPWLEWGYPSHYTHCLTDEPFLGFEGCLAFISRVANAMTQQSAFFRGRHRDDPINSTD